MKETLENIIKKIKLIAETTREETGSFKYDVCYDECIEIINEELKNYERK